jgi:nucleoside-diphosphate-sugar epimerase
MVVGRGMLAQAFDRYREHPKVVIFASGVSDSTVTDVTHFQREETLLGHTLAEQQQKRFVYFGTCSVLDEELSLSPYVAHKQKMERLIQAHSCDYVICRLPQAVGRSGNANTLMNRLYASIANGQRFQLWRNAHRYIIDVDDVSAVAGYMIEQDQYSNRIVNVASRRFSMFDIVRALEKVTQRSALYTEIDKGASYDIDCNEAHKVARLLNIHFDDTYLYRVIRKYYTQ